MSPPNLRDLFLVRDHQWLVPAAEIAHILRISLPTVMRWARGHGAPNAETMSKLQYVARQARSWWGSLSPVWLLGPVGKDDHPELWMPDRVEILAEDAPLFGERAPAVRWVFHWLDPLQGTKVLYKEKRTHRAIVCPTATSSLVEGVGTIGLRGELSFRAWERSLGPLPLVALL